MNNIHNPSLLQIQIWILFKKIFWLQIRIWILFVRNIHEYIWIFEYSLHSVLFLKASEYLKKIGHCTLERGGKKNLNRVNKWRKKICKKLFPSRQFYTLYKQQFLNLRPLLSITFGHWTWGSAGKKTAKQSEKVLWTDRQTNTQTNIRTFQLIESISPKDRCFENDTPNNQLF